MDLSSLYDALGVSANAEDADIRSAYRRKALATHPDKGGSPESFRLVVTVLPFRNLNEATIKIRKPSCLFTIYPSSVKLI